MPVLPGSGSIRLHRARVGLGRAPVRGAAPARRPRSRLAPPLFALLACLSPAANAQLFGCTVHTANVAFGTYDPIATTSPLLATGNVQVSCVAQYVTVALSAGSGSYADRTLRLGASVLHYNLYTDPNFTTVWGDGSSGTGTLGRFVWILNSPQNFPMYGRIMPGQDPSAGLHVDSITVEVRF